jgi:transcriptional regulator with XRE-family HTH domain
MKVHRPKPPIEDRTPVKMSVGKRIATLRQMKGLSLPELADRAGISKGYLWQIENESGPNPSLGVLTKVAEALETTVAGLLGRPGVRARQAPIPEALPPGLKEFLDEQKRRGAPVAEDIVWALASLKARGRKTTTKDDWAFLYEAIKRAMGRRETT